MAELHPPLGVLRPFTERTHSWGPNGACHTNRGTHETTNPTLRVSKKFTNAQVHRQTTKSGWPGLLLSALATMMECEESVRSAATGVSGQIDIYRARFDHYTS
jgi:hypothetical protein